MGRIKSTMGYSSAYDDLNTKEATFSEIRFKESSAMALEGLRDLTSLRRIACSKPSLDEVSWEERIDRLQEYIHLLFNLVQSKDNLVESKAGLLPFMRGSPALNFEWTIPQYSSPHFAFFNRLEYEVAFILMLYAATLRQQADALVVRTCDSAEEEGEDFVAAAKLFQRVAGITASIADFILPEKAEDNTNKVEQTLPQLVRAMSKAALGEAQAVFASRAESKNFSPQLVASLHLGASEALVTASVGTPSIRQAIVHHSSSFPGELFEAAASELKPQPSQVASQPFRMFLALSSELHQARARCYIAAFQSAEGKPGAACADLLDARKRLREACVAAETHPRWIEIFEEELQKIDRKMEDYDRERSYVSMERVAPHRSAAPPAKISVKATPFVPDGKKVNVFTR